MEKSGPHRPQRIFENALRLLLDCELSVCPSCGEKLKARRPWHMRKSVQTLKGPIRVAGKSKECANPDCSQHGRRYYASRVNLISLPNSTYGLDMLTFIGWQHKHEHKQLVEIQRELNRRDILVNERNVGRLFRQFLGLLGAVTEPVQQVLEVTAMVASNWNILTAKT
jgi:hypothetical protein